MAIHKEFITLPAVILSGLHLAAAAGLRWPTSHVGQVLLVQERHRMPPFVKRVEHGIREAELVPFGLCSGINL